MFFKDVDLQFSFPVWLWHQSNAGCVEWVWRCSFLFFRRVRKFGVGTSLNVCLNLLVKPTGPGLQLLVKFLITDSISLLVISLFRFSITSWLSLDSLYCLWIYPFLLGCPICWHIIAYGILSCISVITVVTSPFSLPILFIWVLSFSWWVCLKLCQFCLSFQKPALALCSLLSPSLYANSKKLGSKEKICKSARSSEGWKIRDKT